MVCDAKIRYESVLSKVVEVVKGTRIEWLKP